MKKNYLYFVKRKLGTRLCFQFFLAALILGSIPQNVLAETPTTSLLSAVELIQSRVVSGTVTDDTGSALPGVNILEKGTTNGTVSDTNGKFRISVASSESVLVFSFVGTVTQQVTVGSRDDVSVQLASDAQTLSEIVVVGYGTQEKKDVTGSVASVKSDDFNKGIINSPEQLLQGKVSGVNITSASGEPGSAQRITIRGVGSMRAGVTPLFVVDGMILDNSGTGGAINPLSFLNPQDIETMDVLKDASATAIYGTRGANGVILITTKKGKSGKSTINYSSSIGISKAANKIDVFGADEFRKKVVEVGGVLTDLGSATNWQDEIMRTAYTQNHNLGFSGGTDNLTYFASLGLQDQDGILKNSNLKRYTGRVNLHQKGLGGRLQIDFNMNATNTVSTRPPIESLLGTALSLNPTYPAYDQDGKPSVFGDAFNPLLQLKLYDDITNTTRIIGNISPSFEIIKGLVYKLNFGIDNSSSDRDIQNKPSTTPFQIGDLNSYFTNNRNKMIENYLTYALTKGEHNINVLAGHSYQRIFVQSRHWGITKFADTGIEPRYNPGLGQQLNLVDNPPSGGTAVTELQSFFGRINYSFRDRYLFTATVRSDGSSRFGGNNKYGTFPSFSAGWRLSDEPFMESLPVSNLKLRAGWGQTGNQEFPGKQTQAVVTSSLSGSTSYPLDNGTTYIPGIAYSRLANPSLQWETSTQSNIGVDFGFLSGALTGTIDYFNKVSTNVLASVTVPDPINVVPEYYVNVKNMKIINKGLELALDYKLNVGNDFKFGVGANITFISNTVKDAPFKLLTTGSASGSGLTSATINGYVNGEPIGTFYMKDFIGIDANGLSKFRDANNDNQDTADDRIAAGSALPNKLFNFYTSAGYKGFDLSISLNGVSGNKIYNNTANTNFYKAHLAKSLNTTSIATEFPTESLTNPAAVSTRYLEDGSFLRLNNATLGYNFNPTMIGMAKWITALRLSVTGQNLFVITNYTGYDPEVNTDRTVNSVTSFGIDYNSYPKPRTLVIGLNVSF